VTTHLAGIDVSHDTDVAVQAQGVLTALICEQHFTGMEKFVARLVHAKPWL
jgi:hypothetical protein